MPLILDMVHHNPGEPPFSSAFSNPAHLVNYGFNGQVFKHLNCVATYVASGYDAFPAGSPDLAWMEQARSQLDKKISHAKANGLSVFCHIDLFVMPRRLVEHFRSELVDDATGAISLENPRTLELHEMLFDELCSRFSQVDGFIVRVGETYLFDTPFHVGNGAVPHARSPWTPTYGYEAILSGRKTLPSWSETQVSAYIKLIRFLREKVCVKHGKQVLFRTWDIYPDRLHARLDHYLDVTDQVEPHPLLIFSIKHTALDFWRRVKVNPCLGAGKHRQIVEVQCQREYEGKGAYPNYVMRGVIDGFEENRVPTGLRNILSHPLSAGVFCWSRGGGWYGPYPSQELWPDLNAYVLAQVANDLKLEEKTAFDRYAKTYLFLTGEHLSRFRDICLLSAEAVLHGQYCEPFDKVLSESLLPSALWMRDDRLGGYLQLLPVLRYLYDHGALKEALEEKKLAVSLWEKISDLGLGIAWPNPDHGSFVTTSVSYGLRLSRIIYQGWRVLTAGYAGDRSGHYDVQEITEAAGLYHRYWAEYRELAALPACSTLYEGRYFNLPGTSPVSGLDESVSHYLSLARQPSL